MLMVHVKCMQTERDISVLTTRCRNSATALLEMGDAGYCGLSTVLRYFDLKMVSYSSITVH
jgi:hypothetical protein